MGVLPLQFRPAESLASLGLTGREIFDLQGSGASLTHRGEVSVRARRPDGSVQAFSVLVRIDTPEELTAFRHGGILPYVVRRLATR